jgi:hypothetical protein
LAEGDDPSGRRSGRRCEVRHRRVLDRPAMIPAMVERSRTAARHSDRPGVGFGESL